MVLQDQLEWLDPQEQMVLLIILVLLVIPALIVMIENSNAKLAAFFRASSALPVSGSDMIKS